MMQFVTYSSAEVSNEMMSFLPSTKSPSAHSTSFTVPLRGALTVCSIFMASRITSWSPFLNAWPGAASSLTTFPAIGDRHPSPPRPSEAPKFARFISNVTVPSSENTYTSSPDATISALYFLPSTKATSSSDPGSCRPMTSISGLSSTFRVTVFPSASTTSIFMSTGSLSALVERSFRGIEKAPGLGVLTRACPRVCQGELGSSLRAAAASASAEAYSIMR
mmetsp:Transcript_1960/g.3830  ORF Transcript_1960/g.3830 Transcript_1960/m.3830 type:complete len:221 (-) Transcript_1960:1552-2214(-)